jgi:signal transduction histidine kinase
MTMATLGLFSLPVFLVLVGLPIAIFLGGTLFIPGGNYTLDYENLIFLFSLTLISFVISRSFFAATIGDILKTYKLETLNRELHSIQMSLIQKEKFASIGQLSAGIAHEINNPLGFVKSNISALEQGVGQIRTRYPDLSRDEVYGPFFENLQGLFRDTKEGFRRISEVIDNLRIFAQEMPEGDFGLYNLNQGIESTLVVARSGLSNVTKIEKRLGTVPAIEARGSEINQVLMNLLLNANHAVKNSPSGRETSIIVSTWSENNFVFCEITDSGPGVDPRIKSRIFDPFFTTKPAGVGMGLGLSLSYEIIVNRHRGTLVLKDGLPTTFRMALPIRRPSVGPAINGK